MSLSRGMSAGGLLYGRHTCLKPLNLRLESTSSRENGLSRSSHDSKPTSKPNSSQKTSKATKSWSDTDEEVRRAMEGLAGDGGEAGAELEDGKPVSMKRGVRENMFRYI